MCASVVAAGHEVHLVVPTGKPETQIVDGVIVHGLSLPSNRIERIYRTVSQVLNVAAELQGDLYQFHDPEFLRVSVDFQQKTGAPVVYDSHEDYRLQMLYKSWLPRWSRRLVAASVGRIEDRAVCKLAGVIAATPSIAERFGDHPACVVIQNFPITANTNVSGAEFENRVVGRFGYVGSLSIVRGAKEMIDAIAEAGPDVSLELGGAWQPAELREVCVARRGWRQVIERGYLERDEVYSMFGRVFAGLTLLHPVDSYLTAYSTKMFEYMSVGLPVIASDFPLWRRIV
jgi:glycosyltransferase involved in cell wall biosynthesis